jgi:hypothetical protein
LAFDGRTGEPLAGWPEAFLGADHA